MVLRLVAFLGLIALGLCQGDAPGPTEGSADMLMTTAPPPEEEEDLPPPLAERFERRQANRMREDHFYCLGMNNNQMGFPNDTVVNGMVTTARRWGLFIQYPILNYLETLGKQELLRAVANVVRLSDNPVFANFDETDFCIATVHHYGVSTYEESIVINLYFEDEDMYDIGLLNAAFRSGFNMDVDSNPYVTTFLGRRALIIDLPGHNSPDLDADDDPTQRAVVIATFVGNTYIERALNPDPLERLQSFAENPNPINFGLEAGDIVFAVIGSIFLAIVGGLIVLGFFIHPFFLA